jgi:hypothetical protein
MGVNKPRGVLGVIDKVEMHDADSIAKQPFLVVSQGAAEWGDQGNHTLDMTFGNGTF